MNNVWRQDNDSNFQQLWYWTFFLSFEGEFVFIIWLSHSLCIGSHNRCLTPNPNKEFDVLAWWKANQGEYPILSRIAIDLYAIPGMSAEVERVFSGFVPFFLEFIAGRNRLSRIEETSWERIWWSVSSACIIGWVQGL